MHTLFKVKPLSPSAEFSQHLSEKHFWSMMLLAFILHLLAVGIYALMPRQEVIDIPVRSLNIKLGGGGGNDTHMAAPVPAQPVAVSAPVSVTPPVSVPTLTPPPEPVAVSNIDRLLSPPETAVIPPRKVSEPVAVARTQVISQETAAAAQQMPTEFVRAEQAGLGPGTGGGAGTGVGTGIGNSTGPDAEILRRYEQLLSLWIERHKTYPDSARQQGLEGEAVIRIRIDRNGAILFYRLEQPTPHPLINQAIDVMVRNSNPVPAVPSNYPPGGLFEFLVPVSFKLQ